MPLLATHRALNLPNDNIPNPGRFGRETSAKANEKLCNSMKSESIYYHREKRVKHVTSHSLDAFRNKVTLLT